jgi:hypothetical protein
VFAGSGVGGSRHHKSDSIASRPGNRSGNGSGGGSEGLSGRDLHGDSDGHGQCQLQSDLQRYVQGDSCGESRMHWEGQSQGDCGGDFRLDWERDLPSHFEGDCEGDLLSD